MSPGSISAYRCRMRYLVLFLLCACGRPMTSGDACDVVVGALCDRAEQCTPGSLASCRTAGFKACCPGCDGLVKSEQAVSDCAGALKAEACSSLLQGSTPAVCAGVTRPQ